MFRTLTIAAMFALMLPAMAVAQEHHDEHKGPPPGHPGGPPHPPPHPGGPPPQHPQFRAVQPHGPMGGPPHPGPAGAMVRPGPQFTYHGHPFNRFHAPHPFIYPPGWAYRRWAVGAILPPLFLVPQYYYTDWAGLGLDPPPPGFQWVRYGPDLLLVNVDTGAVAEVIPDVFY